MTNDCITRLHSSCHDPETISRPFDDPHIVFDSFLATGLPLSDRRYTFRGRKGAENGSGSYQIANSTFHVFERFCTGCPNVFWFLNDQKMPLEAAQKMLIKSGWSVYLTHSGGVYHQLFLRNS